MSGHYSIALRQLSIENVQIFEPGVVSVSPRGTEAEDGRQAECRMSRPGSAQDGGDEVERSNNATVDELLRDEEERKVKLFEKE